MRSSAAQCNIIRVLQARGIIERSKPQKSGFVVPSHLYGKPVSSELSRLLLRSSKEPEIVPDLTQSLSLWQRLEWASRVRRRHQQSMVFDENPLQLEFDFGQPTP